jgi:hypothetical protein
MTLIERMREKNQAKKVWNKKRYGGVFILIQFLAEF